MRGGQQVIGDEREDGAGCERVEERGATSPGAFASRPKPMAAARPLAMATTAHTPTTQAGLRPLWSILLDDVTASGMFEMKIATSTDRLGPEPPTRVRAEHDQEFRDPVEDGAEQDRQPAPGVGLGGSLHPVDDLVADVVRERSGDEPDSDRNAGDGHVDGLFDQVVGDRADERPRRQTRWWVPECPGRGAAPSVRRSRRGSAMRRR